MIIKYIIEKSDEEFHKHLDKNFDDCNASDTYRKMVTDIQYNWAKIRACKIEYLKLYSEQTNIKSPDNEYGYDTKEEWGLCINSNIIFPVPASLFECSVGSVRKLRNKVPVNIDTGTCKSCPFFIPRNRLESRTVKEIKSDISTSKSDSK